MERLSHKHARKDWCLIFLVLILLFFKSTQSVWSQESTLKLRVVAEQANIRLEPDIASIIIRQLSQGAILDSTGKEGEWYAVEFTPKEGITVSGYVHESLVIVIEPLPVKKETPKKIQEEEKPKKEVPVEPLEQDEPQISPPAEIETKIPQEEPFRRFHFTLFTGGNYAFGGDLNKGSLGLANFYSGVLGIPRKEAVKPVHFGFSFGGEFSVSLTSRLSLAIAIESFQGEKESLTDFGQVVQAHTLKTRPKLSAVPAGISVSYLFIPSLYIKGGISYYFAECSYYYQIQEHEQLQEWMGEASARGLGLQGALGFSRSIGPRLGLVVELAGHYAKINGFQGKDTFQSSSGQTLIEKGTLYLIQAEVSEQQSYPLLFIRASKPREAGVIDAREAQIDFSGFSLKIGLRIHL